MLDLYVDMYSKVAHYEPDYMKLSLWSICTQQRPMTGNRVIYLVERSLSNRKVIIKPL